jgi:hypothetical protein
LRYRGWRLGIYSDSGPRAGPIITRSKWQSGVQGSGALQAIEVGSIGPLFRHFAGNPIPGCGEGGGGNTKSGFELSFVQIAPDEYELLNEFRKQALDKVLVAINERGEILPALQCYLDTSNPLTSTLKKHDREREQGISAASINKKKRELKEGNVGPGAGIQESTGILGDGKMEFQKDWMYF